MEHIALAALGIATVALLFVRSLRQQVRTLRTRVESLESELDASVVGDASYGPM